MKKLYPVVALCLLSLLLSGQSPEQAKNNPQAKNSDKAAPQDSADKNRITLDVSRVNMLYTVSDKKGRFVTDLTKDDFEVFESKKPQTIIEFAAESDLPLRLAILIDTSNSIRDRFHFQQEAATAFIDGTVRPEHDRAMVVSFDTSAELVADLTDNISDLEKAVEKLRPGGGTSLPGGIVPGGGTDPGGGTVPGGGTLPGGAMAGPPGPGELCKAAMTFCETPWLFK